MVRNHRFNISAALSLALAASAVPVHAATVAYWTFENGTPGNLVAHSTADGVFDGTTPDASGNGNSLSTWTQGSYAGFQYRGSGPGELPWATTPQTGVADNVSIKNTGGYPAMFTSSSASHPSGTDVEAITPATWTVEASYKPENGGYRTVVGRDAQNVTTSDGNLAAFYMGLQPDGSAAVKYADQAGNFWIAASAPGLTTGFDFGTDPDGLTGHWYNLAGEFNGTDLLLYVNGVQVADTPVVSTNSLMNVGTTNAADGSWHAGGWSVGRGLYAGGHSDRAYGYIDDVRISDTALDPSAFLQASPAPEPASLGLLAVGALALVGRRRRA